MVYHLLKNDLISSKKARKKKSLVNSADKNRPGGETNLSLLPFFVCPSLLFFSVRSVISLSECF